jgi:hypothetical protein
MSDVTAGGLPTTAGNPTVTVSPATVPWDTTTWPATTVSVAYTDDYLFLNGVVGWFGGSLEATTLQSQATMRNELGSKRVRVSGLYADEPSKLTIVEEADAHAPGR